MPVNVKTDFHSKSVVISSRKAPLNMEGDSKVYSNILNESLHIPKQQVMETSIQNHSKRRPKINALPMEKVKSALRLLSGISHDFPKQINSEIKNLEKFSTEEVRDDKTIVEHINISMEQDEPDIKTFKKEDETGREAGEKRSKTDQKTLEGNKVKEFKIEEMKKELEIEKIKGQIETPNYDGIEELFIAKKPDIKDEYMFDVLRNTRKGVCYEIAENPEKICKKGICKPTPHIKQEKSESNVEHTIIKKICRRENEQGLLSCISRPPAIKEKKIDVDEIDTSHCKTVIETTIFKASATTLTSEKVDETGEVSAIDSTINKPEAELNVGREAHQISVPLKIEGIIAKDEKISKANIPSKMSDYKIELGAVCECCKCVICKCKPLYAKRTLADESNIEVKKVKDLHHGQVRKKMVTKYSWDTMEIPNPWDFVKDQKDARKSEKDELIARAEKLEKERNEVSGTLDTEVEKDDKTDFSLGENREKEETERDWQSYKSIEWAGLRHEYTENVKSVDIDKLEELTSISWTSQPPPQFLLGTMGTPDTKLVSASTMVDLEPISERKSSFVKIGTRGVKLKINRSKAGMSEQDMERKRRQIIQLKKNLESGTKRKRDVKTGVQLTSASQIHSVKDETEISGSIQDEHRREIYASFLADLQADESVRRTKIDSSERMSKKITLGEIDENLLPMGLKREAERLRKSGQSQTESIASRKILEISKSLPPHDAKRLVRLHSLDELGPAQSCPCLPGYCTCGEKHWTLKSKSMQNFNDLKPDEVYENTIGRTDSDLKAAGIYAWKGYECPCSHSYDEIQTTPEVESTDFLVTSEPIPRKTEDYSCPCTRRYEQTVIIVKPDAMIFEDVIRRALVHVGGLQIVNERRVRLSPEQVAEIYAEKYYGSESYPLFILRLSRMPVLVLSVVGLKVTEVIQSMVGYDKFIPNSWFLPESIKRRIMIPEDLIDAFHISEDAEQGSIETRYFFPQMLIEPIPTIPSTITDFCQKYLDPTLSKGLAAVARIKPVDPIIFLAEWLLTHNPFQPWYKPQKINMKCGLTIIGSNVKPEDALYIFEDLFETVL